MSVFQEKKIYVELIIGKMLSFFSAFRRMQFLQLKFNGKVQRTRYEAQTHPYTVLCDGVAFVVDAMEIINYKDSIENLRHYYLNSLIWFIIYIYFLLSNQMLLHISHRSAIMSTKLNLSRKAHHNFIIAY